MSQHAGGSLLWRFWWSVRSVPVLGRLAMIAMEAQAAGMALRELRACGVLERADVAEAARGLLRYCRALFADDA